MCNLVAQGWVSAKQKLEQEVNRHPTSKETERWESFYIKVDQNQMEVIERALGAAGLMLGTGQSLGYCLELICADFLGEAHLENGNPKALLFSTSCKLELLSSQQRKEFLSGITAPN